MTTSEEEEPRVGHPLSDAEHASIDPEKLRSYAPDPDHPVGQHKAKVFHMALGIQLEDWEYLRDAILEKLPNHPVTGVRPPKTEHEAYTWEVLVPITGLKDKSEQTLKIITAWEIIDAIPILATTRVAPKTRQ